MVDENDVYATNEAAATEVLPTSTGSKKKRAPRRSPAEIAAANSLKSAKSGGIRKAAPVMETKLAPLAESGTGKALPKSVAKPKLATATAPMDVKSVSVADEMAELLQLEAENNHLRKSLAEKLRAENADLRRRLGHA